MEFDTKNLKQEVFIDIKNNIKIKNILIKYNIPKSTLYYWLKQDKKILAKLRSEGINTMMRKVQSLMLLLNIKSKQKLIKSEPVKKDESAYYVNKLKRLFNQDLPNKYWVSDVTELKISRNKFCLCVILDLFSRKVVAYRLLTQNNTSLTINTFKAAYENRNRPAGLSFHSDQGANYTAYEFKDLLRLLKVEQSFSHKGNPYDIKGIGIEPLICRLDPADKLGNKVLYLFPKPLVLYLNLP